MRVVVWLVVVLALIGGALYGVGHFLLPNTLEVSQSAQIARPRAAVFAMMNDLKIFKEWSPYYALDPDADYSFTGDSPGPGQSMRWNSNVRHVGAGRMTIVRAAENREVDSILEINNRVTLNSRMSVARTGEGATTATWNVAAACMPGAINVPCRYMNLVLRPVIEKDLASGLARLKTLAEQLPDVDFEGLAVQFENVPSQPFVFSTAQTSSNDQAEVDRALNSGVEAVRKFMQDSALTAAGPLVRQTTAWNAAEHRMSFNVGYPFEGPAPLTVVTVQIGQTPGGPAMKVVHVGPRATVQQTYAKAYAYLQAHRIAQREDGLPWEVVLPSEDGADPAIMHIEIYIPLQ